MDSGPSVAYRAGRLLWEDGLIEPAGAALRYPKGRDPMSTKTYRPNIEDVRGDDDWTPAELKLLASCETGKGAWIGSEVPTKDDERVIRASLIRYLLLGGCAEGARPHPKGVEISGAWIEGELEFVGCETSLTLLVQNSHFTDAPNLRGGRLGHLNFIGSHLPGLNGHSMHVDRGVSLSGSFEATVLIDLSSAGIEEVLDCQGGTFSVEFGKALNCNAITVGNSRTGYHGVGRLAGCRSGRMPGGSIARLRSRDGKRVRHAFGALGGSQRRGTGAISSGL